MRSHWQSPPRTSRLVAQLGAGILLLLFLASLLAWFSVQQGWQNAQERLTITTQNLAQLLEDDIVPSFDRTDLMLQVVADEVERQMLSGGTKAQELDRFIGKQYSHAIDLDNLRVADATGAVVFGTGVAGSTPVNIADRDYFVQLRDNPRLDRAISRPIVSRVSGKWIIIMARRIKRPGTSFAGVAFASISLEHFKALFATVNIGLHGRISLHDLELNLIARNPGLIRQNNEEANRTTSKELLMAVQAKPVAGIYQDRTPGDNIERKNAYRKLSRYPYYIIVGLATEDYLGAWRQDVARTVGLTIVFALMAIALAYTVYSGWRRQEADLQLLTNSITERKRTEEELRLSKAFNVSVLDSIAEHIAVLNAQGVIIAVNRAWQKFAQENSCQEETQRGVGLNYFDICRKALPDETAAQALAGMQSVLAGQSPLFTMEYPCHSPDAHRWFVLNVSPLEGTERGLVTSHTNISQLRRTEHALQRREESFHHLAQISPVGIFHTNAQGECTYVNKRWCEITGLSVENSLGDGWRHALHPEDSEHFRALWRKILSSRQSTPIEGRVQRPDGTIRWVSGETVTELDERGNVLGFLGIISDMTERRGQEERRRVGEVAYRNALVREVHHRIKNNLQSVSSLLRRELGKYLDFNPRLEAAISQLHAIAVVHGLQSTDGDESIVLYDTLSKICQAVQEQSQHRVVLRIEDEHSTFRSVQIDKDEAVAVALILNELILNSVKHSPKNAAASLVTLKTEGRRVHIAIRNALAGDGHFDIATGEGIGTGLRLVRSLMPNQGAKLDYEMEKEEFMLTTLVLTSPVVKDSAPLEAG
jgi:PAS domain S-box-containing protein